MSKKRSRRESSRGHLDGGLVPVEYLRLGSGLAENSLALVPVLIIGNQALI